MDSIADWHRYVDSLSRPVRRKSEEGTLERDWGLDPEPWRPWNQDEPEQPAAAPMGAVPDLAAVLSGRPLGVDLSDLLPPTPEEKAAAEAPYRDLTVEDTLPPVPEFTVPSLSAPTFELNLPKLEPVPPPTSLVEEDEVEIEAAVESVATAEVAGESEPDVLAALREATERRALLSRLTEGDADQGSEESRARRESRQELLQRLNDPVLTLEETAVILDVCTTTVRRYTNKGLLRHFRTKGNQRRFRLSDVTEFMISRAEEIRADSLADRARGEDSATEE